uniref:RNA-directed DNA polymerase, eukaryota, reverse transcriptase zinc-binding domain protein n=1 Tax=Tanacetum cinerariifolium TaxID=118510 RepID=A0A6L2K171_TANCI|nr:RNA-directed DNA polymerase, eukaryota, reverse transcriptase zinc-binding domain protein [Tanacetum cinerariifolium]
MKAIQSAIDLDPFNKDLRDKECDLLKSYVDAGAYEDKLLCQKSKIKWLSYGDKNNAFFHKVLKGRYKRNITLSIHNEGGKRFDGDQVATQFVNHFEKYLGSSLAVQLIFDGNDLFSKKLTDMEANYMIREVNDNEIREAMFSIGDNKAHGPDGYAAKFFKKAWNIVGKDVCNDVKEFFSSRKLIGEGKRSKERSIKDEDQKSILDVLPFSKGKFHMKYLGVHLISKRLGTNDCKALLDKIKSIHIKYEVGNRRKTLMCVADVLGNNSWMWPADWYDTYHIIGNVTVPLIIVRKDEKVTSVDNNGNKKMFDMWNVYHDLKNDNDEVVWGPLVWFMQCIPKHAFILWMTVQEKHLTHDIIKKWGSYNMVVCSLCKCSEKSRNHLFFKCKFSLEIWKAIQNVMDCQILDEE